MCFGDIVDKLIAFSLKDAFHSVWVVAATTRRDDDDL